MTDPEKAATGAVYVLIDPRDNHVRYVGATTKTLEARLQGHMSRAAMRVKAWIDVLAAEGLKPRIEPVNEGVPAFQLRDRERDEITRRLIAGERLLNEAATAQGRRAIERRDEEERVERKRAAWEHVANQVRSILGGPLAPGDVAPIPLDPQAMAYYQSLLSSEAERSAIDHRAIREQGRAEDVLWRSVRPVWGRLRGRASRDFEDVLEARVCTVFKDRGEDLQDASRYLALLPWGITAVGPWAALADRAGLDSAGEEFICWVSDDATVRDALRILLIRSGKRMGPLWALDNVNNLRRPSTGLVVMTAAHSPAFDLPRELSPEVQEFLESILRDDRLTPAMSALLSKLDPRALNRILGPNVAADTDVDLGLPPGTSLSVLAAVQAKSPEWRTDRLDRAVDRARGAFPTVETLDFSGFSGTTAPMFQIVAVSLMASGLVPLPGSKTLTEVIDEVRALWHGDLSWLGQAA